MNIFVEQPGPIIGLDTSRSPLLLFVATPSEAVAGGVIPEAWESFESLPEFRRYWDLHWRAMGVPVAIPKDPADPLGARAWLESIWQPIQTFDWLGYSSHLRGDHCLENMGIEVRFRRSYVLTLYACHRIQAAQVATALWAKLLDACSLLEEVRHSVHRLAAAMPPSSEIEVPF